MTRYEQLADLQPDIQPMSPFRKSAQQVKVPHDSQQGLFTKSGMKNSCCQQRELNGHQQQQQEG